MCQLLDKSHIVKGGDIVAHVRCHGSQPMKAALAANYIHQVTPETPETPDDIQSHPTSSTPAPAFAVQRLQPAS